MSAQWYKTRAGSDAVVFATNLLSDRPYLGAWCEGENWYPASWGKNGSYDGRPGHPRALDLMMNNVQNPEQASA